MIIQKQNTTKIEIIFYEINTETIIWILNKNGKKYTEVYHEVITMSNINTK